MGLMNMPGLPPPFYQPPREGFPSEEVKQTIIKALNEKVTVAGRSKCPFCGTTGWSLVDGFISIPLLAQGFGGILAVGSRAITCVALVCNTCGNTNLINLIAIGLKHLVEPQQQNLFPPGIK